MPSFMKPVLVVDDDPNMRFVMARLLRQNGYSSITAANTQEALDALAAGPVEGILLDVVLGPENGWETLRLLREKTGAPAVMMSGATMDERSRVDALTMGAQAILQKPFESGQLMACLASVLGSPRP